MDDAADGSGTLAGVAWALRRAELAVQGAKEQQLRSLGMAPAHFSLMMCVRARPGLTGAEAARQLHVTPQAVASLVARLEGRGQLERRTHPRHRHVQELHLTEAGHEVLVAATRIVAEIERRIIDRLGADATVQLKGLLNDVTDATDRPQG